MYKQYDMAVIFAYAISNCLP